MTSERFLNVREASHILRFSPKTVRRMARDGQIPCVKVGWEWRFRRSDLDKRLESQTVEQRRWTVLVVDDDERICELVQAILEDSDYKAVVARNGEEALTLMEGFVPDVIVLDLQMPVMDGPETLKRVRMQFGNIPVVILTAFADTNLMTRALEWSPFTVVRKPMMPDELIAAVKAAAKPVAQEAAVGNR